ncbi:uncharacterized protein C10orf107 homolog [Sinocyclocheilus anshuiensis]|uniref:uncharacterized protein C10orf107 homolog n=1 Tax=Sinocyclocheilus anshuiensis TaxID=1608454 RepID=UPI0007B8F574|nr:PREDICTED: uncharacterized protein C10orf107 homolog [Sinocyclocheilus anshuiensis]
MANQIDLNDLIELNRKPFNYQRYLYGVIGLSKSFEDILNFKNHQTCVKEAALLEHFVSGFWWAKEMNFNSHQISFIMALLQQLLDSIKNKQSSFADNFKAFTQTVLATRQSPSTEAKASFLFTTDQIKAITDYFKNILFQHFRLYDILFTHSREKQLLKIEKCIEVIDPAEFAAPLEEGMPADLYFYYMAPPRVQTPEQVKCFLSLPAQSLLPTSQRSMRVHEETYISRPTSQRSMRVHEETYISRLERLQKASSV